MRKNINIILIVLILLLAGVIWFLLAKDTEPKTIKVPYKVEVKVPAVSGQSDTIKNPSPTPSPKSAQGEPNSVNQKLLNDFIRVEKSLTKSEDSIRKLNKYIEAITEQIYNLEYIDSVQNVKVYSRVRGSLLEQSIEYDVFERSITATGETEIEIPQYRSLSWLVEGGYSLLNPDQKISGKATLIFENKKNQKFSLSPDTNGNVWVGFGAQF